MMRVAMLVCCVLLISLDFALRDAAGQDVISAEIQRTGSPPVIDGLGNDAVWAEATAHGNDEFFTVVGSEPDDEADLSMVWKALWDDTNLYVLIDVTDDAIVNDDSCNWEDDSVEVYIDAQNLDVTDYRPFQNPDFPDGVPAYQFTSIAGDSATSFCNEIADDAHLIPDDSTSAFRWGINSYDGFDDDTRYPKGSDTSKNVKIDDTHYSFEVAFPWEALEETPADIQARGAMGFGIAINDDDDGGQRDTQVMWDTTAADLWMRSDTFPSVALSSATVGGGVRGDFNADGKVDLADVNLLNAEIDAKTNTTKFDLTNDGKVDVADLTEWVTAKNIKNTWIGDADLNGEFNTGDFVQVFQKGKYEDTIADNAGWDDGDWNGDREFDSGDFVAAFQGGGFERGPRAATAAVPEPAGLTLLAFGALLLGLRSRRGAGRRSR